MTQDKEQSLAADDQRNLITDNLDERIYLPSFATDQALCGNYEYARQLFDCWINEKCEPPDYRIFFNRAICNYELEEYDKALADVNVAIRMNEKWPKGE
jgi:tetratricopeptide (TPR) repeat protein